MRAIIRPHIVAIVATAVATVAYFAAGMPGIEDVPGWFYRPADKQIGGTLYVLAAGAALPIVAFVALRVSRAGRHRTALALLTLFAIAIQLAFALVPGNGLFEVWRRHYEGHGQFFAIARQRAGAPTDTLVRYEVLAREGDLGSFAPSKPPGALGVYMLIDAVGHSEPVRTILRPLAADAAENPRVKPYAPAAALSSVLMPLLTALLVPAIGFLAVQVFRDGRTGVWAALLVFTAPSVLLISYHLDGAVYPLIAVLGCALLAHAARDARYWESVIAGAVLAAGVWTSFSLIPAVGLAFGCLALVTMRQTETLGHARAWQRAGFHLAAAAAGALAVLFVLRVTYGFEIDVRYEAAMAHHARWKRAVPTSLWRGLSLVEFGVYLGVPLAVAWLYGVGRTITDAVRRRRIEVSGLAVLFVFVMLVALALVAGTNEVARLWLFMVPFIALVVVATLRALESEERDWSNQLTWLAGAQVVVALVMKGAQVW